MLDQRSLHTYGTAMRGSARPARDATGLFVPRVRQCGVVLDQRANATGLFVRGLQQCRVMLDQCVNATGPFVLGTALQMCMRMLDKRCDAAGPFVLGTAMQMQAQLLDQSGDAAGLLFVWWYGESRCECGHEVDLGRVDDMRTNKLRT